MEGSGRDDPREMPPHFFMGSRSIRYGTAVRAEIDKQNYSICPRHWYIDATFTCDRCQAEFLFSVSEQRAWYEVYRFWVDSIPRRCLECRRDLRNLRAIRQEYDRTVREVLDRGDLPARKRLADLIDQLYELGGDLPDRINETRRRLASQIAAGPQ